jgi:pyruvate/2-oxoglutarate dehydrogenase complex dihydrolipoamide dehydrogenase (E3) component
MAGSAFAGYLADYVEYHQLDIHTYTKALDVRQSPRGGWQVGTATGELNADIVVVATGKAGRPLVPAWASNFDGAVLHSAEYRVPEDFHGKRVLVVGSGNSATEIATELTTRASHVWLSIRTSPLLLPTSQLGVSTHRVSVLGAALPDPVWDSLSRASHWSLYRNLRRYGLGVPEVGSHTRFRITGMAPVAERGFAQAVRNGLIEIVPGTQTIAGAEAQLDNGATLLPDTVILATGYQPSYPELLADAGVLRSDGTPMTWAGHLPRAKGLFVVGAPSLQGDIREHGREAKRVARAVEALANGSAVEQVREGAR